MAFISLGKIDKNLIPLIIGCIICFLDRLLKQYDEALLFKNTILTNLFISFSRLFALIPYLILKKRSEKIKVNEIEKTNNFVIEYIYTNIGENIKDKYKYILLSALVYFIQAILFIFTFKIQSNTWSLYILTTPIFYYLILKIKLYRHHYLCIVLILLIGLIIDISLENIQNDLTNNLLLFFITLIREILFSFHNVFVKYIMEKKFVSVYEYTFYNGLIHFSLTGIFALLDYLFFKLYNYEDYFNNFNITELLVLVGILITQFILNLSLLFTIKNNTPCHAFILYVFGRFAYYINSSKYYKLVIIVVIIGLLFMLLFSLIFNEIIEINLWGLSYNTRKNIAIRAEREGLSVEENEIEDENNETEKSVIQLNKDEIYI